MPHQRYPIGALRSSSTVWYDTSNLMYTRAAEPAIAPSPVDAAREQQQPLRRRQRAYLLQRQRPLQPHLRTHARTRHVNRTIRWRQERLLAAWLPPVVVGASRETQGWAPDQRSMLESPWTGRLAASPQATAARRISATIATALSMLPGRRATPPMLAGSRVPRLAALRTC